MMESNLKRGDKVYYARIMPNISYDVYELKIRTVENDWFTATEKDTKMAFLFNNTGFNKVVFKDRKIALDLVLEAEKHRKYTSSEIYYEEY